MSMLELIVLILEVLMLYLGFSLISDLRKKRSDNTPVSVKDGTVSWIMNQNVLLVVAAIIFITGFNLYHSSLQSILSNSLYDKKDGTYCYTAELTSKKGKTYTLPAKIIVSENEYALQEVYFSNGNSLEFDAEAFSKNDPEIDYARPIGEDSTWKVKIINKPNYSKHVQESEITPLRWTFVILDVLIIIFNFTTLILYFVERKRYNSFFAPENNGANNA